MRRLDVVKFCRFKRKFNLNIYQSISQAPTSTPAFALKTTPTLQPTIPDASNNHLLTTTTQQQQQQQQHNRPLSHDRTRWTLVSNGPQSSTPPQRLHRRHRQPVCVPASRRTTTNRTTRVGTLRRTRHHRRASPATTARTFLRRTATAR